MDNIKKYLTQLSSRIWLLLNWER